MPEIERGDFVTIGDSSLTWKVISRPSLHFLGPERESPSVLAALCQSGQTGIERVFPVASMTLHTKEPS